MRFPWLQVDADFIGAHAADLGAMLGVSRREAIGLALDLWTWALARAPDDAPPDGRVTGPVPVRLLSGSVGWTGTDDVLVAALLHCGLMVTEPDGYRLTGFSRYVATFEKNRRRTGGKPERNRTGTGEEPARKTQTQTQTQTKEDLPLPSSAALEDFRLEPKPTRRGKKPRPEKPTDPRHAPLARELRDVHGWPHHGGRTARAVTQLLGLADQVPETARAEASLEVNRRAAFAKASEGFPRVRELHELVTHWGHFATGPPGRGATREDPNAGILQASPTACAGCGAQGETANVGEPETMLGYACGCLAAWTETGLRFPQAQVWAERRKREPEGTAERS